MNHCLAVMAEYSAEKTSFANHLVEYFRRFKQLGKRDRTAIRHAAIWAWRVKPFFPKDAETITLVAAGFQKGGNPFSKFALELADKAIEEVNWDAFHPDSEAFKLVSLISEHVDSQAIQQSLLLEPNVFIRVKTGHEKTLLRQAETAAVELIPLHHSELPWTSFQAALGANLTELPCYLSGSFEVQDLGSQLAIARVANGAESPFWDACCASGGKSLAFLASNPYHDVYASDVRTDIIRAYNARMTKAKLGFQSTVVDLSTGLKLPKNWPTAFPTILADVPCSGSGTWNRAPERWSLTKLEDVEKYADIQARILKNLNKRRAETGRLWLTTCSIFTLENEAHGYKEGVYHSALEFGGDTLYSAYTTD
jgi:16S rRNA (cytosine967-C5)-methyltransferase